MTWLGGHSHARITMMQDCSPDKVHSYQQVSRDSDRVRYAAFSLTALLRFIVQMASLASSRPQDIPVRLTMTPG